MTPQTAPAERVYAALLHLYPGPFREEYGDEMRAVFAERWRVARTRGLGSALATGLATSFDAIRTAASEHAQLFAQDVRHAVRSLWDRRQRSFTVASVATLALALGGTITIYSLVHAVLLAPLPFREAERVVMISSASPSRGLPEFSVSTPDFLSWQARTKSFSALAGISARGANVSGDATVEAERVAAFATTASLFDVLGLPLVLGRSFSTAEDAPGGPPVTILGEELWRRRFGADPTILGRSIAVDGEARTVVGVAPRDVGFSSDVGLWLPLAADPTDVERGDRRLKILGRLAPNATLASARSELQGVAAALEREFPETNQGWIARVESARDWIVQGDVRSRLYLLLAAVAVLLTVACANVANLQLARSTARVAEIGVRRALGASAARVVRHLMTENLVLAGLGGMLGLGLAALAIHFSATHLPATMPRLEGLRLDGPVALFALLITALTALGFGLLPAWLAGRANALSALARGGRSAAGVDARRAPLREGLVVAQLALATMLAIGAALLAQSFSRLAQAPLGFRPEQLLTARVTLPEVTDEASFQRTETYYQALLREIDTLPGVRAVGLSSEIPLGEVNTAMSISAHPGEDGQSLGGETASWRITSAGYLSALGVPKLHGRTFAEHGEPTDSVILSAGLAKKLFPQEADPSGKTVFLGNGQGRIVIGVVGDVQQLRLDQEATPTMYFPTSWYYWPTMTLAVRTEGDPATLTAAVRQAAARIAPDLPLFDLRPMNAVIAESIAQPRIQTWVVALFAGLALLLAGVGIAGVVAYTVAQRTPELAVRAALGATPRRIIAPILRRAAIVLGLGVTLGLVLAAALSRALETLLFGVSALSPATYLATALVLGVIGFFASWLPARRASKISPARALLGAS